MRKSWLVWTVVCLMVTLGFVGCGGGGDNDNGGGSSSGSGDSANVSVTFPNLFDQDGSTVLPTYISHVITSDKYPLANIVIQNTGGPFTAQVSIDLPTYGTPATQTVSLASGETKSINISPIINYTQLFQNTTALPAALNVDVTSGNSTLFSQSYPIQISGRNTVFFSNNGEPTIHLIATMVTPQDKIGAIQDVLRGAANRFVGGTQMLGYQPASFPSTPYSSLYPGTYQHEDFYLLAGESPSVLIDSVTTLLGSDNIFSVIILDDSNYNKWTSGQSANVCAIDNSATAGTSLQCPAVLSDEWYHIVYFNPFSNILPRTVTRHRPMSKWEVTYYQSQAIFEELRAEGLTYINLPGSGFFSSSQNVRYPAESLSHQGANCLDGSLLFASALEAMGMKPLIDVSLPHGHAFASVRCWSEEESNCVIPIETTMIGGSASFGDAFNSALTNYNSWVVDGSLQAIDIKKSRKLGLTPAPM